jgi:hypothetical protein
LGLLAAVAYWTGFPLDQVTKNLLVYIPAMLAYSWIGYGPYLISYLDEHVFHDFWREVRPILRITEDQFKCLYSGIEKSFHEGYFKVSLPLSTLAFFDAIFMVDYAKQYFHVTGLFDPFYWCAVGVMLVVVFLSGFGFWGVFCAIKVVYKSAPFPISLNPMSPDRFGGLMAFGRLAIRTTLLFSSGSALLPFLLQVSAWTGGTGFILGVLSACVYIMAVAFSFIFPILYVHRIAIRERNRMLKETGEEYLRLLNEFNESPHSNGLSQALRIVIIRNQFLEIEKMKVYPFDWRIILELVSSVALPIILTAMQIYVELYIV